MATLVLALILLAAVVVIPVGLPGTWVIVGVASLYNAVTGTHRVNALTIVAMLVLAVVAELTDMALAGRYAKRYGGTRRAAWGAVLGGLVGAVAGVPVPVIGSVIGAFAGAFLGAFLMEATRGTKPHAALRVAKGALVGRLAGTVVRVGIGSAMAACLLFVVSR